MKRYLKWLLRKPAGYIPFEEKPYLVNEWTQYQSTIRKRKFECDSYRLF